MAKEKAANGEADSLYPTGRTELTHKSVSRDLLSFANDDHRPRDIRSPLNAPAAADSQNIVQPRFCNVSERIAGPRSILTVAMALHKFSVNFNQMLRDLYRGCSIYLWRTVAGRERVWCLYAEGDLRQNWGSWWR